MDSAAWETQWREIFARHSANLLTELSGHFEAALRAAKVHGEQNTRTARRETAENLNQAFRRLRQTSTQQDALALLVDATSFYCQRAALFTLNVDSADCECARGFAKSAIHIDLAGAAAFRSAIDSKDPVVAAGSASEISSTLFDALGGSAGESVYLFPLVVRQAVLGLLFAAGEVLPAPLELLSGAAALHCEALTAIQPGVQSPDDLVQLKPSTADRYDTAWNQLSPEDQALHLRAQRMARVKAAEIRLHRADAVRDGRERGELYRAIRPEIDAARAEFRRDFIGVSPTMVDYLHLELIRGLAHEDDRLLGPDYPGPLV